MVFADWDDARRAERYRVIVRDLTINSDPVAVTGDVTESEFTLTGQTSGHTIEVWIIAVNAAGEKLSKQTLATALDDSMPVPALWRALEFLGQQPPHELRESSLAEVWDWAMRNWSLAHVPQQRTLPFQESAC